MEGVVGEIVRGVSRELGETPSSGPGGLLASRGVWMSRGGCRTGSHEGDQSQARREPQGGRHCGSHEEMHWERVNKPLALPAGEKAGGGKYSRGLALL